MLLTLHQRIIQILPTALWDSEAREGYVRITHLHAERQHSCAKGDMKLASEGHFALGNHSFLQHSSQFSIEHHCCKNTDIPAYLTEQLLPGGLFVLHNDICHYQTWRRILSWKVKDLVNQQLILLHWYQTRDFINLGIEKTAVYSENSVNWRCWGPYIDNKVHF